MLSFALLAAITSFIQDVDKAADKLPKFECVSEAAGLTGSRGRKFSWGDYNNDGPFDLWVSNLVHKFVGQGKSQYDIRGYVCDDSKIYINQGGPGFKFTDVRPTCKITPLPIGDRSVYKGDELWSSVACADFDNDGYIDVFVPQIYNLAYARTLLFMNNGDLTFSEVALKCGINYIDTYGAASADYNCDGYIDIVTHGRAKVGGPGEIHLLMNKGSGNSWIEFRLKGSKCDRAAIGAVVKIKQGGRTLIRQVEGSAGAHSQQNSQVLHFGLGSSRATCDIEIIWPGGKTTKLSGLATNKIHDVTEK